MPAAAQPLLRPPLALSFAGYADGADPRALIDRAHDLGFRAVALDATRPGLRPRELDRSARRELAALLRRLELRCAGLDLWIPPAHFSDPARTDRALDAAGAACALAAELAALAPGSARAVVSLTLPEECPPPVRRDLEDRAARVGARIADHAWPPAANEGAPDPNAPLGVGIDPAVLLLRKQDPAAAASQHAHRIVSTRLSDSDGAVRVAPGKGGLDVAGYAVALATGGIGGDVVLDLRGLRGQDEIARDALDAWANPGPWE